MNNTGRFVRVFSLLGEFLAQFPRHSRSDHPQVRDLNARFFDSVESVIAGEHLHNPWFTKEWVEEALRGVSVMLDAPVLKRWLETYRFPNPENGGEKTIGLILAGNIPLVGFHDILCVLASGQKMLARASAKDKRLIRIVCEVIRTLDSEIGSRISFTDERLKGMDAVIATGSNNSGRYFDYYFRNIPHIIRKSRNGVALLTGKETQEQLQGIGKDVFSYFGLGCRNVTKVYVPESYDIKKLMKAFDSFHALAQHHKYANNVDYYRSVYLMNRVDFLDNGVVLLKEDPAIASPVGVVFYERYSEIERVKKEIEERAEEIQCIISATPLLKGSVDPGDAQRPMPWDYADGIDTLKFLTELN